jgi:hypothetical protein
MTFLSGPGQRYVAALVGRVLGDDEVGGVHGGALSGEWVLDVGKSEVGLFELFAVHGQVRVAVEPDARKLTVGVDPGDQAGGAVRDPARLSVVEAVSDLDSVFGVKTVGPSRDRKRVRPEF